MSKWEIKKINILTNVGWKKTWALTDGVLAVNKPFNQRKSPRWIVTHVASGSSWILKRWLKDGESAVTKKNVWDIVQECYKLEVNGYQLVTMPVCESLNLIPLVVGDNPQREYIARAHCDV